ncbi:MAG: acetylxylan esterase [Anaerolineae bacterium]|nr:acetylxylan esterase [Anaerolineae bacterium]
MDAEETFGFDPTYGYDRAALLAVGLPPRPDDFETFWRATTAETARVPLRLDVTTLESPDPRMCLRRVAYDTLGGYRIGAWLISPAEGQPACGAVIGHGYGGRDAPDLDLPLHDGVAIFPCAPGFSLSARADLPGTSDRHVIHGIASRETYILRPSVAALWSAATALLTLYPGVAGHLAYSGGSFGGGLGALALPWDSRFARGHLGVPTFGHHPIRLQCPSVGSGEAVRRYHAEHPEVAGVLAYYDAATAASFIDIPVLVSPALADPAVPPPGQFAVANALRHRELFILGAGHMPYPEEVREAAALRSIQERWFSDPG